MLTASVVLFNTPRKQLDTLFASVVNAGCVVRFYVIDNSPNDKWRILEKDYAACGVEIRYIHNENLGYGASHNLAMQEAIEQGADYHVVLNPDIYFEANVLSELIRYGREHGCGVCFAACGIPERRAAIFVQAASHTCGFDFPTIFAKELGKEAR